MARNRRFVPPETSEAPIVRKRRSGSIPEPADAPIARTRRTAAGAVHESEEKALDERIRRIAREEASRAIQSHKIEGHEDSVDE